MKLLTFNGALVSHGGPREGSGRKSKFTDEDGNPIESAPRTVPKILTDKDIQEMARKKLRELKESKSQAK